jgi:hypothetical protein
MYLDSIKSLNEVDKDMCLLHTYDEEVFVVKGTFEDLLKKAFGWENKKEELKTKKDKKTKKNKKK